MFIIQLIDMIQNVTLNCAEAARQLRMPPRTAQLYWARYRDDKPYLPSQLGKKKGPTPVLTKEHSAALQALYDNDPTTTLKQAQELLWDQFRIPITQSGLQKHLVTYCGLTMKKLEKISVVRNSPATIAKRMKWVLSIEQQQINYMKCIFIDEAGFNFHIKRNFGRSRRGEPAKAIVSNTRGVNITILGAIAAEGVVNLSLRKPQAVSTSKKRKIQNGEERITGKVGTRATHFIDFLHIVMDVLTKNDMPGRILVMDNASIHHTKEVTEAVETRGFKVLHLPPYSPFLNPIEFFWSKLKAGVARELLTKDSTLTPRIISSAQNVTTNDCEGWIKHSISFFPRCLLEEHKL